MKIGTLVICENDVWKPIHAIIERPKAGKVYTIKEFVNNWVDDRICVRLKEISNPTTRWDDGDVSEVAFGIHRFREIHYNASAISELLEERKVEKG